MPRQWADKYGAQWYPHYDGHPPHDDENTEYRWTGTQWVVDDEEYHKACEKEFAHGS